MYWPPKRYRRPTLLAAVVVAGVAGSALAQSLPSDAAARSAGQDGGAPLDQPDGTAEAGAEAAASAQDAGRAPPVGAPIEDKPAFLRATINQVDIGDVFVILRGNDLIIKVSDLERAGMRVEGGRREKQGEDVLVSLQSLTPRLAFVFDERGLALTITADSALFGGAVLDLRAKRPEGIIYDSAPSLFVNYSVTRTDLQRDVQGSDKASWKGFSGFAESGLSIHGHLLYTSGQLNDSDGSWARRFTYLSLDWRDRLTSIILGDVNPTAGDALGGAASLGGVSVVRNFGLDPYYIFLPTQRLSGTTMTPSTVEVYVNGQMVRREQLPPGQFSVQNLPVTSGYGQTQVVIRDAFGNTQTVVNPYYLALGTLARGLHDFSYNFGFSRQNPGAKGSSWNYDDQPAYLFRHRFGLTNWLTVGVRAEGTLHMSNGGPSVALRLPVGELGAAVAVSRQDQFSGAGALLSYSYVGRRQNFQLGLHYQSLEYANLSLTPSSLTAPNSLPLGIPLSSDRQRMDLLASIARNIGKVGSLSLQYELTEWRDQGWSHRITLAANRSITRWMYAFTTVTNTYSSVLPAKYETFAGLSFAPAERVTAGATRSDHWGGAQGHGGTTQATVQQSLPLGPGLGYRVVASQGENAVNEATAQYQGAYGRIEADYQRLGWGGSEQGHASLTATGGLVFIGGNAYLTRPVQDSYALIRVPGVGGVHGTMSNQVIGTTDSKGNLLVPGLLHYYGNRVGIDDKDVPLDHDIGATEKVIAPPTRGGAVVTFPVRRVQSVSGTVVIDDQGATTLPAYGQIIVMVDQQRTVSPIDEAGNFYLENVPPGSYSAEVQYADGVCTLPVAVPAGFTALVNVGTIRCILPKKESK
ncbi:MAG: fimbria/pilus outer membrane usher protein [Polyangia bacterium]